jgi:hypothetical protein
VFVEEPQEISDRWQRCNFTPFAARNRIVAAAGQARGLDLAQAELAADAADFLALPRTVTASYRRALAASNSTSSHASQRQPDSPSTASVTPACLMVKVNRFKAMIKSGEDVLLINSQGAGWTIVLKRSGE